MAHRLVRGDGLVEDDPFRRVGDRLGQGPVGRADGLGRQRDRRCRPGPAATVPVWLPDGPSGTTGVSSSTSRASLRVGSSDGTSSARARPGGLELEQVRAHALLAAGHHDGPVRRVPVDHDRLLAAQRPTGPPLRRARVRTVPHGLAVSLLAQRHGAAAGAGGQVAEQLGRAEGPGGQRWRPPRRRRTARAAGSRPICSRTTHISSRPAPLPPYLLGHQQARPPELDQRGPQRRA